MTEREAIYRLNKHFEEFNMFKGNVDTSKETEANTLAIQALNNQIWLKNLIADYYKDPTAVKCESIIHDLCRVFLYPRFRKEADETCREAFERICMSYDETKRFPEPWEGEK